MRKGSSTEQEQGRKWEQKLAVDHEGQAKSKVQCSSNRVCAVTQTDHLGHFLA